MTCCKVFGYGVDFVSLRQITGFSLLITDKQTQDVDDNNDTSKLPGKTKPIVVSITWFYMVSRCDPRMYSTVPWYSSHQEQPTS
jgi:hypothetical protein